MNDVSAYKGAVAHGKPATINCVFGTGLVLIGMPIYFFGVQSIVHTEYRYVLAVDYFLFALVGVAVACAGNFIIKKIAVLRAAPVRSNH